MTKVKWEIKSLTPDLSFKVASYKALTKRISKLKSTINDYLKEETPENLHQIRIAVRRLRYNMELFISCFVKKKFLIFYNAIANLQDVTGKIRDDDVLHSNLKAINLPKTSESKNLIKRIEKSNIQLKEELQLTLKEFLHSKELKNFVKMLKK